MYYPTDPLTLGQILRNYHCMSDACMDLLDRISVKESYGKKEVIVRQDLVCDSIYFISSGLVRIGFEKNGKHDTVCFGSAGDIFMSFHSFLGREPAAFSLISISKVSLFRITTRKFKMAQERFPELYRLQANIMTEQLYSFEVLYKKLVLSAPEERMRNFWDYSIDDLRKPPVRSVLQSVPMTVIAQYLGITPQTLSKLRRKQLGR